MRKLIIIVIATFTVGFLYFLFKKNDYDLGEHYYYLPQYEAIDIGYPGGSIVYKSEKRYEFSDVKISGDVIKVHSDKKFIIAIQKNHSDTIIRTHAEILNTNSLHYFIILKKIDSVCGPYDKTEYLIKRKQLKIPQELEFE